MAFTDVTVKTMRNVKKKQYFGNKLSIINNNKVKAPNPVTGILLLNSALQCTAGPVREGGIKNYFIK